MGNTAKVYGHCLSCTGVFQLLGFVVQAHAQILPKHALPSRRVWAHSLTGVAPRKCTRLLFDFHSCLRCIWCCCQATSMKLLWKHARWLKNRWLRVHVMSEKNEPNDSDDSDLSEHPINVRFLSFLLTQFSRFFPSLSVCVCLSNLPDLGVWVVGAREWRLVSGADRLIDHLPSDQPWTFPLSCQWESCGDCVWSWHQHLPWRTDKGLN